MSSKVATVGNATIFGRTATVVKINDNINKIFTPEQTEEYMEHIQGLRNQGYTIVKEGQANECIKFI